MLAELQALLLDLDGVVFRGETPLPGATRLVPCLRQLGMAHAFVTNNATLTPEQVAAKLCAMGIEASSSSVVNSPVATAAYLRRRAAAGTRVCVIGEHGLQSALTEAGFVLADDDAEYVVVGLDRHLTYRKLTAACVAIQRGATLLATNADPALPVEGALWPGAGALLAAVVTATGAQPIVIGKPQPALLQIALDRLGVQPGRAAMVGDQIETDVRAGVAAGMRTILVEGDLAARADGVSPDLTVRSLEDLLCRIEAARGLRHTP
jgi:4-nitrophenyl phosphatase